METRHVCLCLLYLRKFYGVAEVPAPGELALFVLALEVPASLVDCDGAFVERLGVSYVGRSAPDGSFISSPDWLHPARAAVAHRMTMTLLFILIPFRLKN